MRNRNLLKERWQLLLQQNIDAEPDEITLLFSDEKIVAISDEKYMDLIDFILHSNTSEIDGFTEKLIEKYGYRTLLLETDLRLNKIAIKHGLLKKNELSENELNALKNSLQQWMNTIRPEKKMANRNSRKKKLQPDIEKTILQQLKNYDITKRKIIVEEISQKRVADNSKLQVIGIDTSASMQRAAIDTVLAVLLSPIGNSDKQDVYFFNENIQKVDLASAQLATQLIAIQYDGNTNLMNAIRYAAEKFENSSGVFYLISDLIDSYETHYLEEIISLRQKGIAVAVIVPSGDGLAVNRQAATVLQNNQIKVIFAKDILLQKNKIFSL